MAPFVTSPHQPPVPAELGGGMIGATLAAVSLVVLGLVDLIARLL